MYAILHWQYIQLCQFCLERLCETRTVAIYNGKHMNLKITTYKVVFRTVEINHIFSRRKFQYLL